MSKRRAYEWLVRLSRSCLTGEWSPERFRRHLEETGAPLVERVTAGEVEVTFVDEPGDDTTVTLAVVIGPRIAFNSIDTEFTSVAGTPFRVLTLRMRSDLRFSYVFRRRGPTGEAEQVPDPFNPPPRFSECSVERFSGASVAVLPDAVPLPWLDQAEARPAPAMESAVLASEFLGNERRIWVSMPPGEFSDESALPLVIHLDGTPDHSAPSVRDALVQAGLIRPCVVVLVDQLGLQRDKELLCNPAFSRCWSKNCCRGSATGIRSRGTPATWRWPARASAVCVPDGQRSITRQRSATPSSSPLRAGTTLTSNGAPGQMPCCAALLYRR